MLNTKRLIFSLLILSFVACQTNSTEDETAQSPKKETPIEKKDLQKVEAQNKSLVQRNIEYGGSAENEKYAVSKFNIFINDFVDAVKANDVDKIKSLTYFPFDTQGMTKTHLILSYSEADFPTVFTAFLKQDLGVDLGDNRVPDHLEKYISGNKKISLSNRYARLGDMRFQKFGDDWKFSWVYLSEKTIAELASVLPEKARQQ